MRISYWHVWLLLIPSTTISAQTPQEILKRGIAAVGGEGVLKKYPALYWEGKAKVTASPEQVVELSGSWTIHSPSQFHMKSSATILGKATERAMILSGNEGWTIVDQVARPMQKAFFQHEKEQFHLYTAMRVMPLLDNAYRLTPLAEQTQGSYRVQGLLVEHKEHRPLELYFEATTGTLLKINCLPNGDLKQEEVLLSDHQVTAGLRWPRKLSMKVEGKAFFDLEITKFVPLEQVDGSLFKKPS